MGKSLTWCARGVLDAPPHPVTDTLQAPKKTGGAVARRAALCSALGLGMCDGKQLLKQLNLYGFTRDEVDAALAGQATASAWSGARVPDTIIQLVTPPHL